MLGNGFVLRKPPAASAGSKEGDDEAAHHRAVCAMLVMSQKQKQGFEIATAAFALKVGSLLQLRAVRPGSFSTGPCKQRVQPRPVGRSRGCATDAAILRGPLANVRDPPADMTPAVGLPMREFKDSDPSRFARASGRAAPRWLRVRESAPWGVDLSACCRCLSRLFEKFNL
jgi:hypothetical protein